MEGANERKGSKYEDMEEEELPAVEHPGLSGVGGVGRGTEAAGRCSGWVWINGSETHSVSATGVKSGVTCVRWSDLKDDQLPNDPEVTPLTVSIQSDLKKQLPTPVN